MDIAIVVPTFNNEDYTIRCFGSIKKNTNKKLNYKIIWVDNASEKESREKVEKFVKKNKIDCIQINNEENLGFVDATNQGIEEAMKHKVKYVVFENNDTEVYQGWLDDLIEIAESDPDIGIVGPITSPCDSWQAIDHLRKTVDDFKSYPKYNEDPPSYSQIVRKKYKGKTKRVYSMVAFFSTLIKAEMIDQIGMLSKDYGEGFGDDDDYCKRALDAGWKIYLACGVFVFHNHRTTFNLKYSKEEIKKKQDKNLKIFKEKHPDYNRSIFKDPAAHVEELLEEIRKRDEIIKKLQEEYKKSIFWKMKTVSDKIKFVFLHPKRFYKKYFGKKKK